MVNVYVVTADGYQKPYGSEIFLIGVFSTREKADAVKSKFGYGKTTEVSLDELYPLIRTSFDCNEYANENHLGGYVE